MNRDNNSNNDGKDKDSVDRFKDIIEKKIRQCINNNNNKKECIDILTKEIIDMSDSMFDCVQIKDQEILSCLELISIIDTKFGGSSHSNNSDDDARSSYQIIVLQWSLVVAVLNQYKVIKNDDLQNKVTDRITAMYDQLIKYLSFRETYLFGVILEESKLSNHQIINDHLMIHLNQRAKLLPKMVEDLKDEKKQFFAAMAIRSLVYTSDDWECQDIFKESILKQLMKIINDKFKFIRNEKEKDKEKENIIILYLYNESVRLVTNLTLISQGMELIGNNDSLLKFICDLLKQGNPNYKVMMSCSLYTLANIIITKEEWRDRLIDRYGLLTIIMDLTKNPSVYAQSSEELSNVIASLPCIAPLPWATMEMIIPFVKQYYMHDAIHGRNVAQFLDAFTMHPEFVVSVIKRYGLDQYILDSLDRDIDLYNSDWFFMLDYTLRTLNAIMNKDADSPSLTRIFTYEQLHLRLLRLLQIQENYRITDHVIIIMSNLIRLTPVPYLIKSRLVQEMTSLVYRFNLDLNGIKVSDYHGQSGMALIERKVQIDDVLARSILPLFYDIIDRASDEEQEFHQLIQQGMLLMFHRIYPCLNTTHVIATYIDCFDLLFNRMNQPANQILLQAHLFQLGFDSFERKPSDENNDIQVIKDFLVFFTPDDYLNSHCLFQESLF
ncbi:hypothetical protein DFA_02404 [Cavenderia fasciculata]|uniref:Armadillo-like helical domain-containing protein n=1 Tax=Cavenderia fasciculata TaxID=261658 RepID=F4PZC8_CACFS|nr:uncharacterized protein DFA_02404 [Cavenderia fasciculata]EGG19157.1 hypothetical protein DFA_02404 [Cavenderia fasciculata]|eukprot:XP_004366790.1 hypothetical protein DFA_02404 [Cavenderia fasciculata]